MGGLFSKPKAPPLPDVPPPPALPDDTDEAGDAAARRLRRRSGFQKTILTGSLTPETGKKNLLG